MLGGNMSKESFKEFVRKNPKLVTHVNSGEMNWQKFYEMYDMYGEENEVWTPYLTTPKKKEENAHSDFMDYFKNINLDSIQESISSIQRVLGVLGDLAVTKDATDTKPAYEPKPIYKHFDD